MVLAFLGTHHGVTVEFSRKGGKRLFDLPPDLVLQLLKGLKHHLLILFCPRRVQEIGVQAVLYLREEGWVSLA